MVKAERIHAIVSRAAEKINLKVDDFSMRRPYIYGLDFKAHFSAGVYVSFLEVNDGTLESSVGMNHGLDEIDFDLNDKTNKEVKEFVDKHNLDQKIITYIEEIQKIIT